MLLCLLDVKSQQMSPLKIGDKCPDIVLSNMMNSTVLKSNLFDYKGKLILIDFWATWCSPCVKSMAKLNTLQQEFKDELKVIPVTYQDREDINDLFKHMPKDASLQMPIVTEDTMFHQLFPHTELPHYVWIDKKGIVINITGGEAVTEENVKKLLSNETIQATVKEDKFVPVDKTKPLFISDNGGEPSPLLYHSIFTGYKEGLSSVLTREPLQDTGLVRLTAINVSIPSLLQLAYSYNGELSARNRMLLQVKDSSKLIWNNVEPMQQWMHEHTFCYELILPSEMEQQLKPLMQKDLDLMLPAYKGGIEKRKVKCLVLTATEKAKSIITTKGKPVYDRTPYSMHLEHALLTGFTNLLSIIYLQNLSTPVINGTGISEPVNLDIETNLSDMNALRNALHPYGLDLIEEEREIEMIVIKDR